MIAIGWNFITGFMVGFEIVQEEDEPLTWVLDLGIVRFIFFNPED